ncbi:LAME_0D06832g1_1 [Lachancea meyersii CBS 8951]|uniref:LAME_0D06832g1_1 n=1 Tax=Lachancea meyersii CBS 8951 TaxID=1266667 RepID=A0A1G4J9K8_9SACH|nr:LAME_0D06832g1_1 [Lachancea meyersii CBS 8951]
MPSYLLPTTNGIDWSSEQPPTYDVPNPRQILRICLNLKYLIDKVVPILYDEKLIMCDHSRILNKHVLSLAREACGGKKDDPKSIHKYQSVIIFSLLKVCSWYWDLAATELHNAELYCLRASAAQQLCKLVIEQEEGREAQFLFIQMLCRRYVINENDEDSIAENALELAMDMHCTTVIGSSGYQRCLKWLWRGWIIQSRCDHKSYVICDSVSSSKFTRHFHPDRLKTPMYQNIINIMFSFVFLVLYTVVVNSKDSKAVQPIEFLEGIFYFFTLGSVLDEISKCYHVGWSYIGFWNSFNGAMYFIIMSSMILRVVSVSPIQTHYPAEYWDKISYRILSCAAPMVWTRLLLYLESKRFVGALLVILKHMMKESIVFFFLLLLIVLGFLQGFVGLDSSDGNREITWPIVSNLLLTVLGAGRFDMFDDFAPPFATILYYSYSFVVSVILLNILIALYSTAYEKVIDNAVDEYMALMAQKTLRYIRAPDEDVYVPPLNLVELFLTPFLHFLPPKMAKRISVFVMTILYFPLLLGVAVKEVREAKRVFYNRMKKQEDDANETDVAWDLTDGYVDEADGWIPNSESSGIMATQKRNKRSLKLQKDAENADPDFKVKGEWFQSVKSAIQPVEHGFTSGIGWEMYDVYREATEQREASDKKIDELTMMVESLTKMVKELAPQSDSSEK